MPQWRLRTSPTSSFGLQTLGSRSSLLSVIIVTDRPSRTAVDCRRPSFSRVWNKLLHHMTFLPSFEDLSFQLLFSGFLWCQWSDFGHYRTFWSLLLLTIKSLHLPSNGSSCAPYITIWLIRLVWFIFRVRYVTVARGDATVARRMGDDQASGTGSKVWHSSGHSWWFRRVIRRHTGHRRRRWPRSIVEVEE